jgi:hypothetical protein
VQPDKLFAIAKKNVETLMMQQEEAWKALGFDKEALAKHLALAETRDLISKVQLEE